eukprot:TRINITY_DN52022_c0_g2_i1.p1 TRINITY_DN52022_c0_g2~~TRINITY_DN52022_c0_g2_i1.p1  ORF type:complete len:843 (-),score=160.40 TRINITY_DN52022_c0_g2_i1:373-2901(-)
MESLSEERCVQKQRGPKTYSYKDLLSLLGAEHDRQAAIIEELSKANEALLRRHQEVTSVRKQCIIPGAVGGDDHDPKKHCDIVDSGRPGGVTNSTRCTSTEEFFLDKMCSHAVPTSSSLKSVACRRDGALTCSRQESGGSGSTTGLCEGDDDAIILENEPPSSNSKSPIKVIHPAWNECATNPPPEEPDELDLRHTADGRNDGEQPAVETTVSCRPGGRRPSQRMFVSRFIRQPSLKSQRSKLSAIEHEAKRMRRVGDKWLLNPEQSPFLERWDVVSMVVLSFVAVVTPFEVCFVKDTPVDWLFFVNRGVDLVFLVDIFLQFFTMYPVAAAGGTMMEYRHHKIILRYLRTWFAIDFVSILPFDTIGMLLESVAVAKMKVVKVIRLLRLLKLARMTRCFRVMRRLEVNMSTPYEKLNLCKFFALLAIISHWLACFWALPLLLVEEEDGLPRWVDVFADMEQGTAVKTKDSVIRLYVASLYFSAYTITSVGYGDIGPLNFIERIINTVIVFISGVSWAYILGSICGIVGSMGLEHQEFRKSMDELNALMREHRLSQSLRRRVRTFFLATRQAQSNEQKALLYKKMSPALRGEVLMAVNGHWLRRVPFLKDVLSVEDSTMASTFVLNVVISLKTALYSQAEVFGRPNVLYILKRGLVSQLTKLLGSGAVWGEDFILTDPKLMFTLRCYAITYAEALTLERDDFMQVMTRCAKIYPILQKKVRQFWVRLAMQRGVLVEARRRQLLAGIKKPNFGAYLNLECEQGRNDWGQDNIEYGVMKDDEVSVAAAVSGLKKLDAKVQEMHGNVSGQLRALSVQVGLQQPLLEEVPDVSEVGTRSMPLALRSPR